MYMPQIMFRTFEPNVSTSKALPKLPKRRQLPHFTNSGAPDNVKRTEDSMHGRGMADPETRAWNPVMWLMVMLIVVIRADELNSYGTYILRM